MGVGGGRRWRSVSSPAPKSVSDIEHIAGHCETADPTPKVSTTVVFLVPGVEQAAAEAVPVLQAVRIQGHDPPMPVVLKDDGEEYVPPNGHVPPNGQRERLVLNETDVLDTSRPAVQVEGHDSARDIRVAACAQINAVFAGCTALRQGIGKPCNTVDMKHRRVKDPCASVCVCAAKPRAAWRRAHKKFGRVRGAAEMRPEFVDLWRASGKVGKWGWTQEAALEHDCLPLMRPDVAHHGHWCTWIYRRKDAGHNLWRLENPIHKHLGNRIVFGEDCIGKAFCGD